MSWRVRLARLEAAAIVCARIDPARVSAFLATCPVTDAEVAAEVERMDVGSDALAPLPTVHDACRRIRALFARAVRRRDVLRQ